MADPRTHLADSVPELSTCLVSGQLVDDAGAGVGGAQLTTLTMTLWALTPGKPIINSNTSRDIKNVNQGTVDGSGNVAITLAPADNAIQVAGSEREVHRMLLTWTYLSGTKTGRFVIDFDVFHVDKAP